MPASGGFLIPYDRPNVRGGATGRELLLRRLDGRETKGGAIVLTLQDRERLIDQHPSYGYSIGPLPFGKHSIVRLASGRIYAGWTGDSIVRVYHTDGTLVDSIAVSLAAEPVTERDLATLYQGYRETMPQAVASLFIDKLERAVSRGDVPGRMPRYLNFLVDEHERLWVNDVTPATTLIPTTTGFGYDPGVAGMTSWRVVARDGSELSAFLLPDRSKLMVLRSGRGFGVATDDLGVETIVVFDVSDLRGGVLATVPSQGT